MKRNIKHKNIYAYSIITGDGPSSVYINGKDKKNFKFNRKSVRRTLYNIKRKKILKNIQASPHTIDELILYIKDKYHAEEEKADSITVAENRLNLRASLIRQEKPELLTESPPLLSPEEYNSEKAVREYINLCEEYGEITRNMVRELDESIFPMDYHDYTIRPDSGGELHIEVDRIHDHMSSGYAGSAGSKKKLDLITKDIYLFYGVTKEDIDSSSKRLSCLVTVLSS